MEHYNIIASLSWHAPQLVITGRKLQELFPGEAPMSLCPSWSTLKKTDQRNKPQLTSLNLQEFPNPMARNPDISVRRWIKWGNSEAEESTSTLVLSSAKSSYVDVRVLLPTSSDSHREQRLPATTSEVLHNCSLTLANSSISHLDWAFAGTSSRTTATADRPAHGIWKRWVDSWQPNSKAHLLKDEGDLFPYYDGAEELELEKGNMLRPETGLFEDYEELWASGPPTAVHNGSRSERLCVVLRTFNPATHGESTASTTDDEERGMIIQVGQWIQGIVKRGENLVVERWVWIAADDTGNTNSPAGASQGSWKRVVHVRKSVNGDEAVSLPCAALFDRDSELVEGHVLDTAPNNGISWRAEEVVKW